MLVKIRPQYCHLMCNIINGTSVISALISITALAIALRVDALNDTRKALMDVLKNVMNSTRSCGSNKDLESGKERVD